MPAWRGSDCDWVTALGPDRCDGGDHCDPDRRGQTSFTDAQEVTVYFRQMSSVEKFGRLDREWTQKIGGDGYAIPLIICFFL
jgi:hypothetical protein